MRFLSCLLFLLFCSACTKLSNRFDPIAFECGTTVDRVNNRYIKLFSEHGLITEKANLRVTSLAGKDLDTWISPKACLVVPRDYREGFVVSDTKFQAGLALDGHMLELESNSLFLPAYDYKNVDSLCKNSLVTAEKNMALPLKLSEEQMTGYEWSVRLEKKDEQIKKIGSIGGKYKVKAIDLGDLEDGSYKIYLHLEELHSFSRRSQEFECNIIIDRRKPLVSLKDGFSRLGPRPQTEQISPGELVFFQLAEESEGSPVNIYYCLSVLGSQKSACTYSVLKKDFIVMPDRGSWELTYFARDEAGNEGPLDTRNFRVVDKSMLASITSAASKAKSHSAAGEWMAGLIEALKAFEDSLKLKTEDERRAVRKIVKESMYQTLQPLRDELIFPKSVRGGLHGLGMMSGKGGLYFLQTQEQEDQVDVFSLTGELVDTLSLRPYLIEGEEAGWRYCHDDKLLIGFTSTHLLVVRSLDSKKVIELANPILGYSVNISNDCKMLSYQVSLPRNQKKTEILELLSEKIIELEGVAGKVLARIQHDGTEQVIVEKESGEFVFLNLATRHEEPVSTFVGGDTLRSLTMTRSGRLAILTREGKFTLFDIDFKPLFETPNVIMIVESLDEDVMGYLTIGKGLSFINTKTGGRDLITINFQSNISSASISKYFVVTQNIDSRSLTIWSRSGVRIDEIHTKGDPFTNFWISDVDYIYLGTEKASRLLRIDSDLKLRQVSPLWAANGLHFTRDGQSLIYKSMSPEITEADNARLRTETVRWDLVKNSQKIESIQNFAAPDHEGTPSFSGYSPQIRSFAFDPNEDKRNVFGIVGYGNLGFFKNENYQEPAFVVDACPSWALDISVSGAKNLVAVACQDGLIYLWDSLHEEWATVFSLLEVFPEQAGIYPVTLCFDSKGESLFVTTVMGQLLKLDVRQDSRGIFSLHKNKLASMTGTMVTLDPKGQKVALLAKDSKLYILSIDLEVEATFELGASWGAMPTGLLFSADGTKVYASAYDGTWTEIDLDSMELLQVRFTTLLDGARNFALSPGEDRLAFSGAGFVQIVDLDLVSIHNKLCSWVKPRLLHIAKALNEDRPREVCQ